MGSSPTEVSFLVSFTRSEQIESNGEFSDNWPLIRIPETHLLLDALVQPLETSAVDKSLSPLPLSPSLRGPLFLVPWITHSELQMSTDEIIDLLLEINYMSWLDSCLVVVPLRRVSCLPTSDRRGAPRTPLPSMTRCRTSDERQQLFRGFGKCQQYQLQLEVEAFNRFFES